MADQRQIFSTSWIYLSLGKEIDYQSLEAESLYLNTSHLNVSLTASEQSVNGRQRRQGVVFTGDTLHLRCQDGYEFSFLVEEISVIVNVNGFDGLQPCSSK